MAEMRIGYGEDAHLLVTGRKLVLGGVEIPFGLGLKGHSDADVLAHAIGDAVLGALAGGDLGTHFPDTDAKYKGISSLRLLEKIAGMVRKKRGMIVNVDATVVAEAPRLAPHVRGMRENVARSLGIDLDRVSVKATTTEGKGFVGRGEGMQARAVVLVIIGK